MNQRCRTWHNRSIMTSLRGRSRNVTAVMGNNNNTLFFLQFSVYRGFEIQDHACEMIWWISELVKYKTFSHKLISLVCFQGNFSLKEGKNAMRLK